MNTNMIKVNTTLPMSKIIELVATVVNLSFDEKGVYHKYLRDYAEALMILSVFTNYDGDTDIDTITSIRFSNEWNNILNVSVNKEIAAFREYVGDEISRRIAPFAEVSDMIRAVKDAAVKITSAIETLDTDGLANLNLDNVNNALEVLEEAKAKKEAEAKNEEVVIKETEVKETEVEEVKE